ncbi:MULTISPECIES: hypothetical protein [Deefgea]|uniref:Circularly permuted type 2 ATP-grasp protein n=1 Tax=Deefgea chitinilytica TaxID=570276 RepID=A0ABS2CD51_9NEIS|nr:MULTISPECIES: hypothetical protein [Deefgea]MBM5571296.1 hypothetical protein [Deefgea chitinilytica]MBM9888528.1 hypothetical protein [Deefgea sp. CFH1-16]
MLSYSTATSTAELLNKQCACQFLDHDLLKAELEASPQLSGLAAEIAETRPHLFSSTMVFITPAQRDQMQAIIRSVTEVVSSEHWQTRALAQAPSVAQTNFGPDGVFFGYDFHLGANGPQLIEINTNAGGAMLNLALARAQTSCCKACPPLIAAPISLDELENVWLAMFEQEWAAQRATARPRSIVILDEAPAQQYLYPEFLLFQRMFERAGIHCLIADPSELRWHDQQLWLGDDAIDMVYNRLTDFYFKQTNTEALRNAFEAGDVVVTPTPRAHALFADKRHLAELSSPQQLAIDPLADSTVATLQAGIPRTFQVTAANADELWAQRRQLFFKPASGYGSKATYRGDKLTKRVWGEILASHYVAQTIAPPSERCVAITGEQSADLKLDIRAYVYRGQIQLFAARLYIGQTTNFRTLGGGFAPVYITAV